MILEENWSSREFIHHAVENKSGYVSYLSRQPQCNENCNCSNRHIETMLGNYSEGTNSNITYEAFIMLYGN